ncbi:hypothetical protein HU200_048386 [Digitaria exilis]|uniref:Homeobox-leucine zipper protein n=1 Tax=Digitaria exilis TaxID=1010633 RepID=A0A835E7J8_9POAL|nr:hypothetical protein HU200_048386 [Digitaria exilis]
MCSRWRAEEAGEAAAEAEAAAVGGRRRGWGRPAKKRRLSDEQARLLELNFRKERKLETPARCSWPPSSALDAKQVAVWFQNRRARHKSKLMEEEFSKLRAAHDAVVVQNCHSRPSSGMEAEEVAAGDLTYISEYTYNSYMNMMDGYFGGVYDQFNWAYLQEIRKD